MAAGFALSRANVEGPTGVAMAKVTVLVRGNRLTIKQRNERVPVVDDDTVESAVRFDRNHWAVTTKEGTWDIRRDKDCGCAGSR